LTDVERLPITTQTLRIVLSYPVALDASYRRRKRSPADPRSADVVNRFESMVTAASRSWRTDFGASAAAPTMSMINRGTHVAPTHALLAVEALLTRVSRKFEFEWAMRLDMAALRPFGKEGTEDLRDFLCAPLWREPLVQTPSPPRSRPPQGVDGRLWSILQRHLEHGLNWEELIDALTVQAQESLSAVSSRGISALADNEHRLAELLGRLALNDRTRLDLASAPTVAGFRDALKNSRTPRAGLLNLERELATRQRGYALSGFWSAWLRTVHRPAIESIRDELRSWLPQPGNDDAPAERSSEGHGSAVPDEPVEKKKAAGKAPASEAGKTKASIKSRKTKKQRAKK
jgi:hypothetical protein